MQQWASVEAMEGDVGRRGDCWSQSQFHKAIPIGLILNANIGIDWQLPDCEVESRCNIP
jgi:hypothetical protein